MKILAFGDIYSDMGEQPFYANGLRFSCTRCSACCRYESGFVYLSKNDVSMLAAQLKIGYNEVVDKYCRWVETYGELRLSLREKSNYDCIFWDQRCVVYSGRPLQCRTFPFWQSILSSAEAWNCAAGSCPGMGRGDMRTREEIDDCLTRSSTEELISKKIPGGKG